MYKITDLLEEYPFIIGEGGAVFFLALYFKNVPGLQKNHAI